MTHLDISLAFNVAQNWPALMDAPSIHYAGQPYVSSTGSRPQPLLADRTLYRPTLNLNDYTCDAVIDWIDIRLETTRRHQAVNMQRAVMQMLRDIGSNSTVHVSSPWRQNRHIGSDFIIRIQQPLPHELAELLKRVLARYAPGTSTIADLKIAGLEVSLDFYVVAGKEMTQDTQNLLRWRMTDALRRHLRPNPVLTEQDRCDPRFYPSKDGKDTTQFLVGLKEPKPTGNAAAEMIRLGITRRDKAALYLGNHHQPPVDATSYVGAENFPVMLRVMDKTTDRRDPTDDKALNLPSSQMRSRVEVTLKEERDGYDCLSAVGLTNLADLYGYKFQEIRKTFFEFFLPTFGDGTGVNSLPFGIAASERDIFTRSGVYGLDRFHRAVEAIRKKQFENREIATKPAHLGDKGRLVSYTEMNQKTARALQALSNEWSNAASPLPRALGP